MFKARRLLYHSTPGLKVITKKKKQAGKTSATTPSTPDHARVSEGVYAFKSANIGALHF